MRRLFTGHLHRRIVVQRKLRRLLVERLDPRLAFTAEGQASAFNQVFETSGLGGTISGNLLWGDGTSSPAIVGASAATGPLSIRFDYSLDANNFFASPERRNTLQLAANSIISTNINRFWRHQFKGCCSTSFLTQRRRRGRATQRHENDDGSSAGHGTWRPDGVGFISPSHFDGRTNLDHYAHYNPRHQEDTDCRLLDLHSGTG